MVAAGRRRSLFERVYSLVVAVKGIDGLLELAAGLCLVLLPGPTGRLLLTLAGEFAEGSTGWQTATASYIAGIAGSVIVTSWGAATFLLVHGVVKVVTVYCLIRRLVRVYPWAMGVLSVLLAVQAEAAVAGPSAGSVLLAVLDVVVLGLVVVEYLRLRSDARPHRRTRQEVADGDSSRAAAD